MALLNNQEEPLSALESACVLQGARDGDELLVLSYRLVFWCVCVCVCVGVCVCVVVCVCVCLCVCETIHCSTCVGVRGCKSLQVNLPTRQPLHVCVCVCVRSSMCVYVCVCSS